MQDRFIGSTILRIDNLKLGNIYVIVHGQKDLLEGVKSKLILRGFKEENILMAKLDEAGSTGDYVAMVWPPGKPREIIVQIVENKQSQNKSSAPGAWEALQQNELYTIQLK